jgi:hypothetical protein
MGSAKCCQGFGKAEVRNDGRLSFIFLNLYAQTKIRMATFGTNHSVTDGMQLIAASIQKLSDFQDTNLCRFCRETLD